MVTSLIAPQTWLPAHRVEDLGPDIDPRQLVRFRLPLLAQAISGSGHPLAIVDPLLKGSSFDHLQIVGSASRARDLMLSAILQRAEVEIPPAENDGRVSPSSVLCSLSEVVAILLRREQNLLEERDAIFPPLVLILDRYDEVLHSTQGDARLRATIQHGVDEILRGGPAVDVHLVIATATAVDDARFTTARAEHFRLL